MWKAFKITLGIILGLLAVPAILALIAAVRMTQ
jgi:hypothetical protein